MPVGGGPTGMPGCMSGGGCSGAPAGGAPGVIIPGTPGMGGGPGMPSGGGAPARMHTRRMPVSKEPAGGQAVRCLVCCGGASPRRMDVAAARGAACMVASVL